MFVCFLVVTSTVPVPFVGSRGERQRGKLKKKKVDGRKDQKEERIKRKTKEEIINTNITQSNIAADSSQVHIRKVEGSILGLETDSPVCGL
jgi:hypothetical protein